MTISQRQFNEDAISLCFQDAIKKLQEVDADANKKKTQIVQDLAKDLEEKIPTDRICTEIVHQLHGKVSETLIRRCLDEKYKERHRAENARKRKKKIQVTADLATPLLLEHEKPLQLVAVTEEGKSVTIDEATAPATNQMKSVVERNPFPKTDNSTSLVAVDKLTRSRSDLEKCPNCSVLRLQNQELEEALRKATPLSTADTLNSSDEESEIEYQLPYLEVQQYMAAEYKKGKSEVWFSVKINVKTKKVTSAKTGRISVDIN
jgi:Zn-finger nucleic acid-binding protein